VTILRYLVRAYQQIGQVDQAIAHLDQLIALSPGWEQQVGRMLTEKLKPTAAWVSMGERSRFYVVKTRWRILLVPKVVVWQLLAASQIGEAAALGSQAMLIVYRATTMKRFNIRKA